MNNNEIIAKLWALYDKYEDSEHQVCAEAAEHLARKFARDALKGEADGL